jgi:hypothetical protein
MFYELQKMLFCSKQIEADSKSSHDFPVLWNPLLSVSGCCFYKCLNVIITIQEFAGSRTWSGHRHFVHWSFLCKSRGDTLQLVAFSHFSDILGIVYILASVSLFCSKTSSSFCITSWLKWKKLPNFTQFLMHMSQ